MSYSILVSVLASVVLTPLLVRLWSRLTPPASTSDFDHLDFEMLRKRNGGKDNLATLLSLVGICLPLVAIYFRLLPATFWLVGLGFGLMVLLPVTYIAAVTLPDGIQRFHEFWRFYELKWGIGLRGIRLIYIPIAVLGLVSLIMVIL
jgi:hypothetical protein